MQSLDATTSATPASTAPLAEFRGMWGFELGDEHHDAQMCGWLHIDEPYVHMLDTESGWHPDIDLVLDGDSIDHYWIILPRTGTRYDPRSRSLWVWNDGPMTDGDHVCVGGSGGESLQAAINVHERKPWYATFMSHTSQQ